jgi:hypothetical protein
MLLMPKRPGSCCLVNCMYRIVTNVIMVSACDKVIALLRYVSCYALPLTTDSVYSWELPGYIWYMWIWYVVVLKLAHAPLIYLLLD